ncbi:MAG TPA: NrfD/PsrC family molybdoenzyme membrane anchor subunit [Candidatus Limnocylindria bacterium]|nr:NrfD/PsrC family molybdoenzyme membrane anchor subunit [Candidatus Limnocylindria bacterium]
MLRTSKLLLPLLAVGVVAGVIGVWDRFATGERALALGSYVPWGMWIGLYVYLVGVSGGAFLVAFLHNTLGIAALARPARYAVPISLVTLGAGLFLVMLDLGRVDRVYELFTRTSFSSVLGAMIWVYTIYGVVLLAMLVALARGWTAQLPWLALSGMVLVVTFGGGEGALFGVVAAKSVWSSAILPVRFLLSAAAAGLALVALATALFHRGPIDAEDQAARSLLRRGIVLALGGFVVVEFAELSIAMYSRIPAVVEAHRLILFGPYWWMFWVVQLGLGIVLPLALLWRSRPGSVRLGAAATAVVVGLAGAKQNIVLPGLAIPEMKGLPEAFVDPRLTTAYFPGSTEWLVAVGVIAAAALVFILAVEFVPFLRPAVERKVAQ